jgi:site-specific recombinase XerD
MSELEVVQGVDLDRLEDLATRAEAYARASKAKTTLKAYQTAWQDWLDWCEQTSATPLPADPRALAMYLTERATIGGPNGTGLTIASLRKRIAAIAWQHEQRGYEEMPTKTRVVHLTMQGIARDIGPKHLIVRAEPALMDAVGKMLDQLPEGVRGTRDRAVLLVGFAGARRRSEIAALNLADVRDTDDGLKLHLRKSKTNQTGEAGEVYGLPYSPNPDTCPVRAWRAWRALLEEDDSLELAGGAAFRVINARGQLRPDERMSDRAVARMVHRYALTAGLPAGRWSGHSLRAGFATDAARQGVQERVIAKQTGHVNMNVLRTYIRDGDLFRENAAAAVLR